MRLVAEPDRLRSLCAYPWIEKVASWTRRYNRKKSSRSRRRARSCHVCDRPVCRRESAGRASPVRGSGGMTASVRRACGLRRRLLASQPLSAISSPIPSVSPARATGPAKTRPRSPRRLQRLRTVVGGAHAAGQYAGGAVRRRQPDFSTRTTPEMARLPPTRRAPDRVLGTNGSIAARAQSKN